MNDLLPRDWSLMEAAIALHSRFLLTDTQSFGLDGQTNWLLDETDDAKVPRRGSSAWLLERPDGRLLCGPVVFVCFSRLTAKARGAWVRDGPA